MQSDNPYKNVAPEICIISIHFRSVPLSKIACRQQIFILFSDPFGCPYFMQQARIYYKTNEPKYFNKKVLIFKLGVEEKSSHILRHDWLANSIKLRCR